MNVPHTEWLPNTSMSTNNVEFIDLFIDGAYQSMWLEHDREHDTWQFVAFRSSKSYHSPTEATMEAAKEHVNTYMVINKLEGKP